jgi:hypothetical protein
MEDSVEMQTRTTVICFGLMTKTQTSANLKELNVKVKYAI